MVVLRSQKWSRNQSRPSRLSAPNSGATTASAISSASINHVMS